MIDIYEDLLLKNKGTQIDFAQITGQHSLSEYQKGLSL